MRSAISLLLLALLGTVSCRPDPVVVGISNGVLPIQGALLALEDARRAGMRVPVETALVQELGNAAAPAIRAAAGFVEVPGIVAVIGHSNSAASLSAAPLYNAARVVQLATHSTAVLYSEAGPFSFRMVPPDDYQGRFLADRLAARYAGRRVAVVYINDEYGRGLRDNVLAALPEGSVRIVADLPHVELAPEEMRDRTTEALVAARPEVILWLSRYTDLGRWLPGVREALGPIPILGGDALAPARLGPDSLGLWEGIEFVRFLDPEARPELIAFQERFRARYGRAPDETAILAYDAMGVILAAIADGARTGEDVRRYLDSLGRGRTPYDGIAGPLTFDPEGDAERDYVLGRIPPGAP